MRKGGKREGKGRREMKNKRERQDISKYHVWTRTLDLPPRFSSASLNVGKDLGMRNWNEGE